MRYREWKMINESLAGAGNMTLGLSNPHSIGGPIGSTFDDEEMDDELEDDEEMDDELEDDEEMEFLDDEEMDFPPDDSEEMLGDDDDFLNDIDPQLADLEMDDDEAGLGPEMLDDEMGDEEMGDDLDVEVGDDEEFEGDDYESFMDRMADYCGKYMASHMAKRSRKFMDKDGSKNKKARKHMCDDGIHSREDMTDMTSNHFGKKESTTVRRESVGTYEETEDQFFNTLRGAAKGDHTEQGWSGLSEDMLLQLNNSPNVSDTSGDPQPGESGFAPQNRVGSIGGGYTQDDISDIETMPY